MPLQLSYDNKLHLLTCRVSGYLTLEEYQNALREILSSDEYPCDVTTLWDLREMQFDNISIEVQKKLVEVRQQFHLQRGGARIALLYYDHMAEPLIKLYGILSKDLSQNTQAFTSYEKAMYWLVYGEAS